MSEKQRQNPEANTKTLIDLYMQSALYLETALVRDTATREPALHMHAARITVSTELPDDLNGKKIKLQYDRPASPDDMLAVDSEVPLAWTDEEGRNHWQTPIRIKVRDASNRVLHDYILEYTGGDQWARINDESNIDPITGNAGGITQLDAKEITAHLEWCLDNPKIV